MLQAVLFDLDGVLVDSRDVWFRVVSEAGTRYRGRAVTREEFDSTFGQGTAADVKVFGYDCATETLDAFYCAGFLRHLDGVWVHPRALEVLSTLKARGLKTALVTNTVADIVGPLMQRTGMRLDVLGTADRVRERKPAPDLVQLACRELQVAPQHAVMVGDSRFDREAALRAGVPFIGLGIDGDRRVDDLAEILGLLV